MKYKLKFFKFKLPKIKFPDKKLSKKSKKKILIISIIIFCILFLSAIGFKTGRTYYKTGKLPNPFTIKKPPKDKKLEELRRELERLDAKEEAKRRELKAKLDRMLKELE